MIIKNRFLKTASVFLVVFGAMTSCKKLDRPALGDFEKDKVVVPTTPLRFFVNFDSTTADDKQINIRFKDSISGYPSFFPDASLTYGPGVHGTALIGNGSKSLSYVNSNDFMKSTSFTVAFWEKHDGAPPTNAVP